MARVHHGRDPKRYPAAILQAETEGDVVAGVRLAAERGWSVGVRSGGHSFPTWGVRDNALLIDLGRLREMAFEEATGIARVSPAIQGGAELAPYLGSHGRFFPSGGCSSVGLGGFLLQGGMGWNHRGWGFAAEQIVAVDVVTADGELVRADAGRNDDLLWAARGAGPGFPGIVTRFHLETLSLPRGLSTTLQVYPLTSYPRVLNWLCEAHRDFPESVQLACMAMNPSFPVPGHVEGNVLAVQGLAFGDTYEESADALAGLSRCPALDEALLVSEAQPTTFEELHRFVDAAHPPGLRYRVDCAWVDGPYPEIVAATRTLVEGPPDQRTGHTSFLFALPRDSPTQAIVLQTELLVQVYIIYEDEEDDEGYRDWSLAAMAELEPYTVGQYWGDSDQQHREVKIFSDENWSRLQEIRKRRDPNGLFVDYLAKESGFRNANGWE